MFRPYWNFRLIAATMLMAPGVTQAWDSGAAAGWDMARVSIPRSAQPTAGGSSVLAPLQSSRRPSREVSLQRGVFLVAKRHIQDPRFRKTVILITGHDAWGSIGLVVNRPSEVPVARLMPEWEGLVDTDVYVYYGGPVEIDLLRFLVRSVRPLEYGNRVLDDVYVVSSKPVFDTLLRSRNKKIIHAYIGYAGWALGQLEHEVERGDWYVVQGDAQTLFDRDPDTVWEQFIQALSGSWVHFQP